MPAKGNVLAIEGHNPLGLVTTSPIQACHGKLRVATPCGLWFHHHMPVGNLQTHDCYAKPYKLKTLHVFYIFPQTKEARLEGFLLVL